MLPDSRCAASARTVSRASIGSRQNAVNGEQNARAPHPNATFALLDKWAANWRDLVDFEIVPVRTSAEAVESMSSKL
jgi:hypothetical protein